MITSHLSRQEAEDKYVSNLALCIVSITDPDSKIPVLASFKHICYLQFHDADKDIPNYNGKGKDIRACSYEDAKKIVAFCEEHKHEAIVAHCEAGISRSAAVALFIQDTYGHKLFGNPMLYNRHVYRMLLQAHAELMKK